MGSEMCIRDSHSAVHAARHDAACVLHTHTVAGVAVSSLAGGLQPCNQWSLQFYNRIAYHDYEGIALDHDERERLVADLGPSKKVLMLRNHGLVTLGRSVAEAFILMLNLDPVSYTHLRAHETVLDLVCRLLLEKKRDLRTQASTHQVR